MSFAAFLLAGAFADDGGRQPISPGELSTGLRLGGNFLLSPDGRWLFFGTSKGAGYLDFSTGTKAGLETERGFYAQATDSDRFGLQHAWFSPAGDGALAWLAYHDEYTWLGVWHAGTPYGTEHNRDLLRIPRTLYAARPILWAPDGKTLYLVVEQPLRMEKSDPKNDNPPTKSANVQLTLSGAYAKDEEFLGFDKLYPDAYAETSRSLILAVDARTGKVGLLAKGNDINRLYLSPDGRHLIAVQTKRRKTPPSKGSAVAFGDPEGFRQHYADVYLADTVPVETLQTPDLEHFDDRTAGWFDHEDRRMTPLLTNVEINDAGVFTPDRESRFGTAGTPAIVWAPDSQSFAYATVGRAATGDVYVCDRASGQVRDLTEGVPPLPVTDKQMGYFENQLGSWNSLKFGGVFSPLWLPDGKSLAIVARGDVWVIPTAPGGQPRNLTQALDREVVRIVPAPDQIHAAVDAAGRMVVLTRDRLTRFDTVWKLDPAGGALTKVADAGVCTDQNLSTDARAGNLVYIGQTPTSLPNIYRLNLDGTAAGGNAAEDVTRFKLELNDRIYPESRVLAWKTAGGNRGYGVLYLPSGASPDAKVPLLVRGYPSEFPSRLDVRAYAGAGYYGEALCSLLKDGIAVLDADIPMSTEDGAYEPPMKQIVDAVNVATDSAVATGVIDEKRMAIMGSSYGGYMVYSVLTRTHRFKTGISKAGIPDLNSFYLGNADMGSLKSINIWTSWSEYRQGRIGKRLWEDPQRYAENSPMSYWDRISVPVLIIHGGLDDTVRPFFAEEAFKGFRHLDRSAIIAIYPREGHFVGGDPEAEQRVRGWLDEQLLGKPPITQIADQGSYFIGFTGKPETPPVPPAGGPVSSH